MVFAKRDVKGVEKQVINLVNIDNSIWEKHGWESHEDVDMTEYYRELKDALRKKGIGKTSGVVYHILENMNYHDLNKALDELGFFGKKNYYADSSDDYDAYRKYGGRNFL